MKKLLIASLFIAATAHAGYFEPTRVYQVTVSSIAFAKIAVSSSTATKMDTPPLSQRVSVEIQNIDSSANLWCTPGVAVSSSPVNGSRKIAPGNTWTLPISDQLYGSNLYANTAKAPIDVFCTTDGAASTNAIVIQQY